jgi:hypothetical protein
MIVVKTTDSSLFEEAYFVVRHDATSERMDMLAEADRIISGCGARGGKKKKWYAQINIWIISAAAFAGGGVIGAAIAVIALAFS